MRRRSSTVAAWPAWPRWLAPALALLCASCGDGDGLSHVEGKVLVGGQPAKGAVVFFHPKDASVSSRVPSGVAGEDGAFTLTTHKPGDGAAPGEYVVTVVWREEAPAKTARRGTAQEPPDMPDRLRGRYANPKTSPLKVEIKKGKNELEPFRLE